MTTDTDCIHKNNQEGLQVGDFKAGDRVRVREEDGAMWSHPGRKGTVLSAQAGSIQVDLDEVEDTYWYSSHVLEYADPAKRIDTPAPDVVAHPPHYRDGTPPGIEVIDIIRAHMKAGGTWETANALKYILRHPLKDNPKQDIAKASQYLSMWTKEQGAA